MHLRVHKYESQIAINLAEIVIHGNGREIPELEVEKQVMTS